MRRAAFIILSLTVALAATGTGASGSALEATDLGEGIFAPELEFDFADAAAAAGRLLSILEESPDTARRARAIRSYYRRFANTSDLVPRLREAVTNLRQSSRKQAKVDAVLVYGYLILDDAPAARAQHIKDLAPLVSAIRQELPVDAWAHLVLAMIYASVYELQGNWFDEALYAVSYGYDDALLQFSAGSFLLAMDLAYGGNERLQWLIYLAMSRAQALAPSSSLQERVKALVRQNMEIPGYRPSKWLKSLISQ